MDHPSSMFPIGSLVIVTVPVIFQGSEGAKFWSTPDDLMLIVDYVHEFSTGDSNEKEKWNVVGLRNNERIVSIDRFTGLSFMRHFKMCSDFRDGIN